LIPRIAKLSLCLSISDLYSRAIEVPTFDIWVVHPAYQSSIFTIPVFRYLIYSQAIEVPTLISGCPPGLSIAHMLPKYPIH
ncbi:hypothetical protein C2G38_2092103, partial [Gigaspora rosea]